MHKEKEHGLSDYCEYLEKGEIDSPNELNITTIFCPDAATNDHEQMILLHEKYVVVTGIKLLRNCISAFLSRI